MSTETPENVPALRAPQPSLAPQNFREAMEFSKLLAQSAFVPKDFRGKPAEILAAIQFGFELGVGPMQALQNIAVINGKPSVYGDLALALVQASGLMEYIKESDDGKVATCETKRRGYPAPCITTFSDEDAKMAGLLGKAGPWTQYRGRMRMFRARGFNLRDNYADVLKGLITREEAEDYPVRESYAPAADAAIDTSAEQVDTATGEVTQLKPTDKTTPQQRKALIDAAHSAMGAAEGEKWLGSRIKGPIEDGGLGLKNWGGFTVANFQTLMKEIMEFASVNQAPPPDEDIHAGDIEFPEKAAQ